MEVQCKSSMKEFILQEKSKHLGNIAKEQDKTLNQNLRLPNLIRHASTYCISWEKKQEKQEPQHTNTTQLSDDRSINNSLLSENEEK